MKAALAKQGTPSTIVTRVVNDQGRPFNVVLVRTGDRYGLDDTLINEASDAMVEFHDATYENDARFVKGRGQFVARYYLSTLTDKRQGSPRGLNLCGHVSEWRITSQNVFEAVEAVEAALHGVTKGEDREDRERAMFGCTASAIDEALTDKEPRDIAMYAMGTLSNAQELIQRDPGYGWTVTDHDADTIRRLINVAKYAIGKAVPR